MVAPHNTEEQPKAKGAALKVTLGSAIGAGATWLRLNHLNKKIEEKAGVVAEAIHSAAMFQEVGDSFKTIVGNANFARDDITQASTDTFKRYATNVEKTIASTGLFKAGKDYAAEASSTIKAANLVETVANRTRVCGHITSFQP